MGKKTADRRAADNLLFYYTTLSPIRQSMCCTIWK